MLTFRAAYNTGFRAPSMQQLYFNNVSTQFVVNEQGFVEAEQVGTFRNDSKLAQLIGIPALKEEQSNNISIGLVANLANSLTITLDYYAIEINDRIVISNRLGKALSSTLDDALQKAQAGKGQFFLNGADTDTHGLDIVATWSKPLWQGNVDFTFAGNFTNTKVNRLYSPEGSALTSIPVEKVFSAQDISIIEQWQPNHRISFSSVFTKENWQVNLAFNRYGEYTVVDGGAQTYGAKLLTDIQVNLTLSNKFSLNFGGNNIFDIVPDKNNIGNSNAGTIIDENGNTIVSSNGVFTYSRRSAPFGFNGSYFYFGILYQF